MRNKIEIHTDARASARAATGAVGAPAATDGAAAAAAA